MTTALAAAAGFGYYNRAGMLALAKQAAKWTHPSVKPFLAMRSKLNSHPIMGTSLQRAVFFGKLKIATLNAIKNSGGLMSQVNEKALKPAFNVTKKLFPAAAVGLDALSAVWQLTGPARQTFMKAAQSALTKASQTMEGSNSSINKSIDSLSNFDSLVGSTLSFTAYDQPSVMSVDSSDFSTMSFHSRSTGASTVASRFKKLKIA